MTSQCRKFVPNVFDIKKCQNCFKSKDFHSRNAIKETTAAKKIVACSYLFISPHGLDFRNVVDRSKRWQRRFFVLHDDGELLFSIDENSQAIPQGRIHLSSCRSVHSGEEITGHANSIALHLESGESYFLRAASRDEMGHWERLLSAFCPAHQKLQSPLTRFQKFSRSISGPLVPQPPPRQQPPRPQKTPPTAASPGTAKVCSNEVEYIETDLDYDLGGSNSKSANNSPFGSKFTPDSRLLRRRPGSVGDQLKSLLNSPGAGSPQEERSSSDGKELTYLKKGWLYVQAPTDSNLQKRWCVLSDGCVTIYRSSLAEDNESPEFALPLLHEGKGPVRLHEVAPDLTYGFLLETAVGNRFAFAAMTAGIRSNWVQALRTCLRLRTAASRSIVRRVPAMRRHTTGNSVATSVTASSGGGGPSSSTEMSNGSDLCDAEVSQILTKKSKVEEVKANNSADPQPRARAGSKTSLESSLTDNGSLSLRSGRSSREAAEAAALRSRVAELSASLEVSRAQVVDLEARLSLREAECLGLSDQCQRLELDVFERERIVSLPTDEERQLKLQLAAHDEALRVSHQRCERAERCVDEINQRLSEQLSSADAELTRALEERDVALREKAAAVVDRDALERRWRTERSHWEAALAQNEAENARLEADRRAAEEGEAAARGAAARGLEAKVASAAERLADAAAPNAWGLAAAVALTGGAPGLAVAPLRALCRRQVGRLVRWLSCRLEGSLLQEEAVELCSSLLQHAANLCLKRCCAQLGMEVPEGIGRRLAREVARLLRGVDTENDEELEEGEMATGPAQVLLLALLSDEPQAESIESADEIKDFSLLPPEEWREASLATALALMETSYVTPLNAKLKEAEEEAERLRGARADLKRRLADLEAELRTKESKLLSATEALKSAQETAQRLAQEKGVLEKKEQAHEAAFNGRKEPSEEALHFWRRELRCALEAELRSAESCTKERQEGASAAAALREQLAAEQAAHRGEVARLRAEFEAALVEEARQTRVAVEAIAREHEERLERELERCREELQAQQQPLASWIAQSPALEGHLESIARRLAALPSCENGRISPAELPASLLPNQTGSS